MAAHAAAVRAGAVTRPGPGRSAVLRRTVPPSSPEDSGRGTSQEEQADTEEDDRRRDAPSSREGEELDQAT